MRTLRTAASGFTYAELLSAIAVGVFVMMGIAGLMNQSGQALQDAQQQTQTNRELHWAMNRILRSVRRAPKLLLPLVDNPDTPTTIESIRPLVAVTLDPAIDRDGDGFADADNDEDGRIDEDLPADNHDDGAAGILGIDDDLDGLIDVPSINGKDNDESGTDAVPEPNDDPLNGLDDDGDGNIDEDLPGDMNGDGAPGVIGVDDDGDTLIDEGGNPNDDDEDGSVDEDWYDVVLFRLDGSQLKERTPDVGASDGSKFTERVLLDNVTDFKVERLVIPGGRHVLIEVTLQITGLDGNPHVLTSRVRAGGEI